MNDDDRNYLFWLSFYASFILIYLSVLSSIVLLFELHHSKPHVAIQPAYTHISLFKYWSIHLHESQIKRKCVTKVPLLAADICVRFVYTFKNEKDKWHTVNDKYLFYFFFHSIFVNVAISSPASHTPPPLCDIISNDMMTSSQLFSSSIALMINAHEIDFKKCGYLFENKKPNFRLGPAQFIRILILHVGIDRGLKSHHHTRIYQVASAAHMSLYFQSFFSPCYSK